MTATDQDEAADRFARYIDKILRPYVPEASRWTLACQIVKAAREEHWRCMPPPPRAVEIARQEGAPPETHATELEAVRAACETASDKHRSRETPVITERTDRDA